MDFRYAVLLVSPVLVLKVSIIWVDWENPDDPDDHMETRL